jgi:hypothetical protein
MLNQIKTALKTPTSLTLRDLVSITIWIDTHGEVPTVVQRCLGGNDSNPTTKGFRIGKLGEKPVTYYFNDFENPNCEWLTER